MPKTRKLQLAFSGGEIDTQMYGRIDAQQYQSGLATCKNWLVDPRGSLRRRPGMQRVASTLDSTQQSRLIPFTYSVDQQLAVEFSNEKARFHTGGGTVVWAAFKEFDSTSIVSNKITFTQPHGLSDGDPIVFYAEDRNFAFLPTPFSTDPDGDYFVRVVDSRTIEVYDDATAGSQVSIGSGAVAGKKLYVFERGTTDGFVGPARLYKEWDKQVPGGGGKMVYRSSTSYNYCLDFTGGLDPGRLKFEEGEQVELVDQDGNPIPAVPRPLYVDRFPGVQGAAGCGGSSQSSAYSFGLRTKAEYVGTPTGLATNSWVSKATIEAVLGNAAYNINFIYVRQYYSKGDLVYLPGETAVVATLRHKVRRFSEDTGSASLNTTEFNTNITNKSTDLEDDGSFSIPTPFSSSELFDIEYDQSGDVVTLTHPNHPPQELRRYSNTNWDISAIDFSPRLAAPTNFSGNAVRGQAYQITHFLNTFDPTEWIIDNGALGSIPFAVGDTAYIDSSYSVIATGYYSIASIASTDIAGQAGATTSASNKITLRRENGDLVTGSGTNTSPVALSDPAYIYYSVSNADPDETYVVTAVDARNQESFASDEVTVENNVLASPGASNDLQWAAVAGAQSYNVYKKINGTFGFIGQVDYEEGVTNYQFKDDNIGPDLSQTLLIKDDEVDASFQPRASARFEQRRCFGGSDALPRTLFMSRTGTESSFSYRFPIQPDDRISVDLASREAHVIRHIVPVQDLLMMTQQGEFRVTAINSDAITPSTIAIRQQSYIGSNSVHPQVVNNSVVFCSARGGHARELNFRVESQGYLTGDLSLRAAHLFDGFTLNDLAYSKAPVPVLWFVSSSGKLLCLTYIPEERVLAWHQHETGGTVESVCSISEGDYDNLYVIVKRGDNRSIERIVQVREEVLEDAVYLDASVSHNGTNTDSTAKFKVFGSNLYKAGDTVTVTAYADDGTTVRKGLFSSEDEGDVLEFTSGGQKYRVKFETDVGNQTYFTGKLLTDWPDALKNTATSSWAWARKTFSGYSHLASQTVTALADGSVEQSLTVSSDGEITLSDYAVKVCAGLPYTSQAKTLPMSLEIEAGAQGRTKNINQVFVRVEDTGALQVGMDEAFLKSVSELSDTELKTGEFRTSVPSTWDEEGQIVVEATGAAPASLLNITTQVSIGD